MNQKRKEEKIQYLKEVLAVRKQDYDIFGRSPGDAIQDAKIHQEIKQLQDELGLTKPKKIKSWVVYCDEYPGGMVWDDRADALESSQTCRDEGCSAYVRVKYFTQKERDELPEGD